MAIAVRRSDGERFPARQVTPETRPAVSLWLHTRGSLLLDLDGVADGAWIVMLPEAPIVLAEWLFLDEFDLPDEAGDRSG